MTFSVLSQQVNDPPLSRRNDFGMRLLDLAASLAAITLLLLGFALPTYAAIIMLVATWSSRFVWAALRVIEAHQTKEVPKIERLVMRGSHLAIVVALYMSALQGNMLIACFLGGVMVLISGERVMFAVKRLNLPLSIEH